MLRLPAQPYGLHVHGHDPVEIGLLHIGGEAGGQHTGVVEGNVQTAIGGLEGAHQIPGLVSLAHVGGRKNAFAACSLHLGKGFLHLSAHVLDVANHHFRALFGVGHGSGAA